MYAQICDPNLYGVMEFEDFDSLEELREILDDKRGVWWHLSTGDVLLSDPVAWVYMVKPDPEDGDPYPDYIVTTGQVEAA